MKTRERFVKATALLLCAVIGSAAITLAQRGQARDPLRGLKRALTEAGAAALTADQETQLNTLITNFRNAQPTEPDAALEAARGAFEDAILAGDLAAAQAQATTIANRIAALKNAELQAEAQFEIAVLGLLRSGGQLDSLNQKFGADRVLELVESLIGHPYGEGPAVGTGRR
ncbi:MAG TPA: hypothetical protein VFD58_29715 [Blastocatellia bacterium]|nr:hypothetical protein [Blastocatellia bacterium]